MRILLFGFFGLIGLDAELGKPQCVRLFVFGSERQRLVLSARWMRLSFALGLFARLL